MKKILLSSLCLLMLCGCTSQTPTEEKKQTEITNNTIILENGQTLKLGQELTDINDYLDNYETLETESSAVFYSNDDIDIFVGMDGSVKKITLLNDTYHLDNDIKVGSSQTQVQKAYQDYSSTQNISALTYQVENVDVTFTLDNKQVTKIELEK